MSISPLSIALTADLHWRDGYETGQRATLDLVAHLAANPPDVLIITGDIGAGDDFARCLDLFDKLSCTKALVPGNHDLWVNQFDPRGDSLKLFREILPRISRDHGFAYLDNGPLPLVESDLAVVGTVNWYDYSWSIAELPALAEDWERRLKTKRFFRGRHNDANFIRWATDDAGFTREVVAGFERNLKDALGQVGNAIAVAHHPPIRGLNFPRTGPPTFDGALWTAFSGNTALEAVIEANADRIPFTFCGHTHRAVQCTLGPTRGYNIGGDYPWKRLLKLAWPSGTIEAVTFLGDGSATSENLN
ncbi:MAG TPA: metallophosphoesterase [Fimbriiglobus sp.]